MKAKAARVRDGAGSRRYHEAGRSVKWRRLASWLKFSLIASRDAITVTAI